MTKQEMITGIESYQHQQKVLLRLIRKHNGLTTSKFDDIFKNRYKISPISLSPDSFILGMGLNGFDEWAWYLDLMQRMVFIGLVSEDFDDGLLTYRIGDK